MRDSDVAHCDRLLREGSKSFRAASLLLPKKVRTRATVLYAFCRVADDLVDADPQASVATVDRLRERLARAYAGRPDDDPVDRALADVLVETGIPPAIPGLLLEGMEWDATGRVYETLADVEAYGARVAGTVGVMMTLAMDRHGDDVLARASELGVAMQLTNIARDVGEDARNGRIYLPREWLGSVAVDAFTPALGRVVRRLLDRADVLYRQADHGVPMLPPSCRVAIRAARLIYSDIGRVIVENGYDSVSRRASTSGPRKAFLLARATRAYMARRHVFVAPPLEATKPLLAACAS